MKQFAHAVDRVTAWLGSPVALGLACSSIILWVAGIPIFGLTDTYQLVINTATTIVTFVMVFVIQNSQNRNDKALQTKLDGMIEVLDTDNKLRRIEEMTESEIDQLHEEVAHKKED